MERTMREPDTGGTKTWAASMLFAYLALPVFPAQAHGMPGPGVVLLLLGVLAVHVATPVLLLVPNAFRGRRGKVFGAYAVIMGTYYTIMWVFEVGPMFLYPVFPVLIAGLLYFVLGKVPEQD
jgi:hypothetical protein